MTNWDLPTAIWNLIKFWRTNMIGFALLGLTKLYADEIEGNTGKDLTMKNATGKDFVKEFSDKIGGRKELFKNSDGDTVGSIDSLGVATFAKIVATAPNGSVASNGQPSQAQIVAILGTAAIGKYGVIKDSGADAGTYLCIANASAWVTIKGTAAA